MGLLFTIRNWFKPAANSTLESAGSPKFSQSEIDAATWFQSQFRDAAEKELAGTPFTFPLVLAVAMQETSYLWMRVYKTMSASEVLAACAGDSLDAPNRSAFPTDKDDLLSHPMGASMFTIARNALARTATIDKGYLGAMKNGDKFCRGYGIFQYDLQHFKKNPDFFVQQKWDDFSECLRLLKSELQEAHKRAYRPPKPTLTEREMVYVAIAYNKGRVDTSGDFRQGHKAEGRYYGENIWRFLQLAKLIPAPAPAEVGQPVAPVGTPVQAGVTVAPADTPVLTGAPISPPLTS